MNEYWNNRFQSEGMIWGEQPGRPAVYALELFRSDKVKTILVPGSGYGRNTRLFSNSGFEVTGVEISDLAYKTALEFDGQTRHFNGSALDMSFIPEKFDAVFCCNLLHFFREAERKLLIGQCAASTRSGGTMFFSVFSEEDIGFGKGSEVEPNTFESKPGRPAHYFSEQDIKDHFGKMEILETGLMEDPENHGAEGPHVHRVRYIYVRI